MFVSVSSGKASQKQGDGGTPSTTKESHRRRFVVVNTGDSRLL